MTEKTGIIVVHGIGDPQPGEALMNLTDSLDRNAITLSIPEAHRLPSPHKRKTYLSDFFPMTIKRGQRSAPYRDEELIFAEVFWGSASQLPAGWMGVIRGTVRIFFRSGVLVDFARPAVQTEMRGLERLRLGFATLTKTASHLIIGPIFALNVLMLVALMTFRFFHIGDGAYSRSAQAVTVTALLSIALSIGLLLVNRARKRSILQNLVGPAQWTIGLACVWLLWMLAARPSSAAALWRAPVLLLSLVFLLVEALLTLLIVVRALHWLILERAQTRDKRHGPPMTIALFTVLIQFGLWVIAIPTMWALLLPSKCSAERGAINCLPVELHQMMSRTDGIQWLVATAIGICGVIALALRWQRTRELVERRQDQGPDAIATHRLIISHWISAAAAVTTLIVSILILIAIPPYLLGKTPPAPIESLLALFTRNAWTQRIASASLTLFAIPLFVGPLRLALDLLNDIITYIDQYDRPKSEGGIRFRLNAVIEYLCRTEGVTRLVIAAHSQGSIIALDELADENCTLLDDLPGGIRFVTMGSPISHIYQYYFPDKYPAWKQDDRWRHLFARVHTWRHYYRIDDFVGARLQEVPHAKVDFAQTGIGVGGHADYWRDRRFVEGFLALL